MILRRVIEHVKAQNWTAVALDFVIVVFGVFIGLQVQQFAVERERRISEGAYLHRLHEEVLQLIDARAIYDASRTEFSANILELTRILNGDAEVISLTPIQCRTIAHSSFTTIPPAGLPTVTELLSAGRLDQLTSRSIRDSILVFFQETDRARDFITAISDGNEELARSYPDLIQAKFTEAGLYSGSVGLDAVCDGEAMRNNAAFLNDFNSNAYAYIHYAERGVLNVSRLLKSLHGVIDEELGVTHANAEAAQEQGGAQ